MLEVADTDLKTFPLDHHALTAAVCKDLRIAERIDHLLLVHDARVVSPGRAVVALILNGLGFTNRRLYLTPQFFASKPLGGLAHLDSALYSPGSLLATNDYLCLTRVPETIKGAKECVSQDAVS
jgi:Domain of unknown function (DUF4277)